jgi:hypothetical protein
VLDNQCIAAFRDTGVVVLRGFFDPRPLSAEVDRVLAEARWPGSAANTGSAGNAFEYVPMMCERTPVSLALLDALAEPAADLLGRKVIPTRAKATRYFGGTPWHRDCDMDVASVGLAAYLEPLDAHSGALRVIHGSHLSVTGTPSREVVGSAVSTMPGDVIAFDEHLFHSSDGGCDRRQWRIDFVADPMGPDEEVTVRCYFAGIFPLEWDGGYDVDRYPSYGEEWRRSARPWTDRLRRLGVYGLADDEEHWMRAHRLQ